MRRLFVLFLMIIVVVGGFILIKSVRQDQVLLYFATKDGMNLQAEHRKVSGDKMAGALQELVAGPADDKLSPTIPIGVEVLSIKVQDGICYVNFNQKLASNHWGGSTGEMLTVYSIVNTIAQFPGVERVQILIEGRKVETLSGHLMLDDSLVPDEDLVK